MAESYTFTQTEKDGIVVFQVNGYFGEQAGRDLAAQIDALLCRQLGKFVLDFSQCSVLSSQGIGCLLEIVDKVIEEFSGALAFTGLDPIKLKVLALTHVTTFAVVAPSIGEAIPILKKHG